MAKPMLVTLALVLLLLDYWPLGRLPGLAPQSQEGVMSLPPPGRNFKGYRWLLWEKLPLLALVAASCLVTLRAQAGSGTVMPLAIRPLGARLASSLVAYIEYIVKMFWPYPLRFYYPLAPVPWCEATWPAWPRCP